MDDVSTSERHVHHGNLVSHVKTGKKKRLGVDSFSITALL